VQQQADKLFSDLRAGLITEAGPLNTPDGATVDEQNFHLLIDGSRRRRKGLQLEHGGEVLSIPAHSPDDTSRVGHWTNAGGLPDEDYIVLQLGRFIHVLKDEGTTLSKRVLQALIDIEPFVTDLEKPWRTHPVSFASGNGVLVVTGRYVAPFKIELKDGVMVSSPIACYIRDFTGFTSESINFTKQPTELTPEHRYNLRNRGWREVDIEKYFEDKGRYPSLSMLWHKGYARLVDDTVYINEDGRKEFTSDKVSAEPFGNQSAPQGSLLVDPFDTTVGSTTFSEPLEIVSWTYEPVSNNEWLIRAQTAEPHGIGPLSRVYIAGHRSEYLFKEFIDITGIRPGEEPPSVTFPMPWSFDGAQTSWLLTVSTGTLLTFRVKRPPNFDGWVDQYQALGEIDQGQILENPGGYQTNERPSCAAWYAGRLWVAGAAHPELADKIMFSQVVQNTEDYGKFHQFNDPTNEALNNLIPTDGGSIQLSDVGVIKGLLPYQSQLLVLADNGVWEITGSRGVFSPESFGIRKITDAKCTSPWGYSEAEGKVFFSGSEGVFVIQPDERTGVLFAQSITETSIQSKWSKASTARQRVAKMEYDPVNKQVWILIDFAPVRDPALGAPVVHQRDFLLGHQSYVNRELSVPPDLRTLLWSQTLAGPWTEHVWDSWSRTSIGVTPSQEIPAGTVWWRVRSRSGLESEPFASPVAELGIPVPVPPPPDFAPVVPGSYVYRNAFVFDIRLNAWAVMKFPERVSGGVIADMVATRDSSECGKYGNLKFFVVSETSLTVADMCGEQRTSNIYQDWDASETTAYLLMGPDSIDNWQNMRQAPVVHVYSHSTEKAFNDDMTPINEGSIKMQSRWDWADNPRTGEWGTSQQVYRLNRPFVPERQSTFESGYPILVTRNKVRGRGRAIQLFFSSDYGKDAHLAGYAIRYAVSGRV
jgi:hypothetical protein